MNNKNLAVTGLAVLAVIFGVSYLKVTTVTNVVNVPEQQISQQNEPQYGAFPGPDVNSPYLAVNGVETYYYSSRLNQASTTICSFKTPAATSTLQNASVKITTGTTTAIALELGKSTLFDATTTRISYVT